MKISKDNTLTPLATLPSSTAEEYDTAEQQRRDKLERERLQRHTYTLVNLIRKLGWSEFVRLICAVEPGVPVIYDTEHDALVRQEFWRIRRAVRGDEEVVFLSFRVGPQERRAIAQWHDENRTNKASYKDMSEFFRVVIDQNLEQVMQSFPQKPRIKRRKS